MTNEEKCKIGKLLNKACNDCELQGECLGRCEICESPIIAGEKSLFLSDKQLSICMHCVKNVNSEMLRKKLLEFVD